ncbi:MAG: hypothetical protein ACRBN8_22280 [Nannocystales bacterium]
MRLCCCVAAQVLFAPALGHAHEGHEKETSDPEQRRARRGGLGDMQLGTPIGPVGDVQTSLRPASALGGQASSRGFGYTIGGGGRALVLGRLVLGGRGFGVYSAHIGSERGFAKITGGGGWPAPGSAVVFCASP